MTKSFDVVALGELLVDFTQSGQSTQGNPLLEACPGGAPCNVLALLQKCGKTTAFVGKVGADLFGRQLRSAVREVGICDDFLISDTAAHTTLAFVETMPDGDRDFSFYRDPGADMLLRPEELPQEVIRRARIFHFGTLSMTHPAIRETTRRAVAMAKAGGALISFDPNLRPPLWSDLDSAREQISWGLDHCDILKIADNELEFMTGQPDFDVGAAMLRAAHPGIRLFNVTAGADGSHCYYRDMHVYVPGFHLGGVIETTGAGDTFCASVLNFVLEHGLDDLTQDDLRRMLRFANAAAYLVTTRKGALRAMPKREEVESICGDIL